MKKLLWAVVVSAAATPAFAQYAGPAVESCRAYAERDARKTGANVQSVIFERDRDLNIDRYTAKVGNQFVSSLLYGNGAIVYRGGAPATEFAFVCLLADEKRPVFFYWLPRRDAPALSRCQRAGAGTAGPCLETLQNIADQELIELYAKHTVDARQADAKAGNENASNAFRRSGDAWKAYRDAECGRRPAGDERKACMVDLTRRRALDLR